jgi:hypothetical protein
MSESRIANLELDRPAIPGASIFLAANMVAKQKGGRCGRPVEN